MVLHLHPSCAFGEAFSKACMRGNRVTLRCEVIWQSCKIYNPGRHIICAPHIHSSFLILADDLLDLDLGLDLTLPYSSPL